MSENLKTLDEAVAAYEAQATELSTVRGELEAAQSLIEEAGKAQADAEAKAVEASAKVEALEASVKEATELAETRAAEIETLKAEAKSAEARAAEICAATGVDPLKTDGNHSADGTLTEQYNSIKDPAERGEFLRKHSAELYKESTK